METKNITSVNSKFIFFVNDDRENDRKASHKRELLEIFEELNKEYSFYQRMYEEIREISEHKQTEIKNISNRIDSMEEWINNTQDDPKVKRGLADICWNCKEAKQLYIDKCHELAGICEICSKTFNKIDKIYNLMVQTKAAIHLCKS